MNITAYLHPERLLIATWELDGQVPILHGYKQFKPDTVLTCEEFAGHNVQLVLHRSDVDFHWFPVDEHENKESRRGFESTAWMHQDVSQSKIGITTSTQMHQQGNLWLPSVTAHHDACQRINGVMHCISTVFCDVDLDIQAALTAAPPQTQPWLLIGRRGALWSSAIIDERHHVVGFAEFEHDDDYAIDAMILLMCRSLSARYNKEFNRVMVFGDVLTSSSIAQLKSSGSLEGYLITRLQPFRKVRSMLEPEIGERLLRHAHVVAPFAGIMLGAALAEQNAPA